MITVRKDPKTGVTERTRSVCTVESCIEREREFLASGRRADLKREGYTHILENVSEVRALVDFYLYHTTRTFLHHDYEGKNTNMFHHRNRDGNVLVSLQLCSDGEHGYFLPIEHRDSAWMGWKPRYRKRAIRNIWREIRRLFQTPNPKFKYVTAHFAQFEDSVSRTLGGFQIINAPLLCTRHLAHLFDENVVKSGLDSPLSLKTIARYRFDFDLYEEADLEARSQGGLWLLPIERLARYGCMDVWVPERILDWMRPKMGDFRKDCMRLMIGLMAPTVKLESHMRVAGWRIDLNKNKALLARDSVIVGRMREILNEVKETPEAKKANEFLAKAYAKKGGMGTLFGNRDPWLLDITKKKDRAFLFFGLLGLKPRPAKPGTEEITKYTKELAAKGRFPSMDREFLDLYASAWNEKEGVWKNNLDSDGKPLYKSVTLWREYQGLKTLRGLFVKKIWTQYVRVNGPEHDCLDGRIHPTYDYAGTVTGRGVSYDPNGQQMPRSDTPTKKKVKSMITADEGCVLIAMDFRANEVRWGAICSGDKVLSKLLWRGEEAVDAYRRNPTEKSKAFANIASDIHKQTASIVFGIKDIYSYDWESMQAKRERAGTKAVIFGVLYGRGARAVAEQLGITVEEAKELIAKIRRSFPGLFEWLDNQPYVAQRNGYVRDPFGRRRRLAEFFYLADEIQAVKRAHRGVWKAEEIAPYMPQHDVWTIQRATKMIAEGGRLAKNSPIQGAASSANNIGSSELVFEIQPTLGHLSPLSILGDTEFAGVRRRTAGWKEYQRACEPIQSEIRKRGLLNSDSLFSKLREVHARWERDTNKHALPARLHAAVHDAGYVSANLEDVPRVMKVMEEVYVQHVTRIAERFYGVKMHAPLAVEFELGVDAGSAKGWDWTEQGYEEIVKDFPRLIKERDSGKIKPAIVPLPPGPCVGFSKVA